MRKPSSDTNTGHLSTTRRAVKGLDVKAPVPQSHRNKLGLADGTTDPYGNGEPSRVPTAAHGKDRPGW